MKIEIFEDVAAPAEFVFRRLTDFSRHERQAIRRGAEVKRVAGEGDAGVGSAWEISFVYRGKQRNAKAEIVEWKAPERFRIKAVSGGLDSATVVDVVALSRTQTRVNVVIDLEPKTLTARLLVQSLKLARGGVTGKLKARLRDMGADMAGAWAKRTDGRG